MVFGLNRIAKTMRQIGLKGRPRKRYRRQQDQPHVLPYAPNLVNQEFTVNEPNKVWVSDITYIQTQQGFFFLAIVMDLYSRKVVGWAMDKYLDRHVPIQALKMAIDLGRPQPGLIHHSVRGVQFASENYRQVLSQNHMRCSMSARGNCYDKAVMESFFGTLKQERIRGYKYRTRLEAKQDIFTYIECFYNRQRRHTHLGYQSPVNFEEKAVLT